MASRVLAALAALPLATGYRDARSSPSVVHDLTPANFDRLVHKEGQHTAAFVYFYAPWCKKCDEVTAAWRKVGEAHASGTSLLVGSVDCSEGPGGTNKLCAKFKAMALPTILFFSPPDRKGLRYGGELTEEGLLAYASELAGSCSLSDQDACSPLQKKWLKKFDATPLSKLKLWAKNMEVTTERSAQEGSANNFDGMPEMGGEAGAKMAEIKKMMKEKEKEDSAEGASGEHAQAMREHAWREVQELRVLKMVIRAKSPPPSPPRKSKRKRSSKDEV